MLTASRTETLCLRFQRTVEEFAGEVALRTPGGETALTWAQYGERVRNIAGGLAGLGVGRGDTVALLVKNRPEFHLLDTAALHLGATPFSIYATSTPEQIAYLFANAGNRVVVAEEEFLDRLPDVEHVLALEDLPALEASAPADFDFEAAWRAVEPGDLATLIYTSGTTGPPKGVMLTHANLFAAWESSVAAVPLLGERGRLLSYLPTAHLADRIFSHYPALVNGSSITCVDDPRAAIGQLGEIRPTVWLAVPRIWEKLKDAIELALEGGAEPAAVCTQLGLDEVDLAVSGAAPIRRDVLEFFAELGLEICEGYGMTECTAVGTLNLPGEVRPGSVGRPVPGIELRLAEDGEVLLRGAGVMAGYKDDPKQTAEAIDAEGWLHTGDIGALDADGYLSIVDRKKELIINAAGKNMSPANIEAALKAASPLIGHAVAIGDRRPYNTALLVLDQDNLGVRGLKDDELRAELEQAVARANERLSRVEQVKRWALVADDWQPDGDLLTPTLKLRRKPIAERYAATIDAMYERSHTR